MAEEIKYIQYTSRIKSTAFDGVLVETDQIKDIAQNKFQKDINADVKKGLEEVQKKIDNSIAGLYRLKGTKQTLAEVKALTGVKKGDVWNVAKGFTLNGRPYTDGTNVVATADMDTGATEANWDALGGTISLEGLVSFPKGASTLTHNTAANTITLHWQKQGELGESSSTIGDIASQSKMTAELGKKADASAVYDRATVDQKITDKANELSRAIGNKVDATVYLQKVDELEKKDGELNTAIGLERKRIDKLEDGAVVTFSDFMLTVPEILQSSIPSGYEICYALNHDVFVARVGQAPSAKYYKTWPTADLYNKDNKSRADKFYLLCKNGVMRPYILFDDGEDTRQLVPVKIGDSSGNNLEERIKALEDLLKMV